VRFIYSDILNTHKKENIMASDNNIGKGLILGLLAGGAIGAIFALLYAPKSGRELRKDIKDKTDEYMEDAEKYLAEARDNAKKMINEGKKKSEKIIDEAKAKSETLLKDAEKIFKEAKDKTNEVVASGKGSIGTESDRLKSAVKAGVEAYKETKNPNS
jgi:gas vesicle protein